MGALAVVGAYLAAGWSQQSSAAPQPAVPQTVVLSIADLEKAFWICDYNATEKGINAVPIDFCSRITEDFKNEKFHGDFEELTNWWRQNKLAAHESLREQERRGDAFERPHTVRGNGPNAGGGMRRLEAAS
jgi:hypothetical protein